MQAILEYQLKRDAEMRQREEEEEAREQAKKARQAQLLAQQEKSLNNQVPSRKRLRGFGVMAVLRSLCTSVCCL